MHLSSSERHLREREPMFSNFELVTFASLWTSNLLGYTICVPAATSHPDKTNKETGRQKRLD
jgi:hypothetical protein